MEKILNFVSLSEEELRQGEKMHAEFQSHLRADRGEEFGFLSIQPTCLPLGGSDEWVDIKTEPSGIG